MDPNTNYQNYGQPFSTGENVLQDTAGFGETDQNGLFGTTMNSNEIFGQTLKSNTDNSEYLGNTQTYSGTATYGDIQTIPGTTTTDTNTYYNEGQVIQGTTTDINTYGTQNNYLSSYTNNQTTEQVQYLPGTTTTDTTTYYGDQQQVSPVTYGETQNYYGTTQDFNQGTTTVQTNTQINYGTTDQTGFGNTAQPEYTNYLSTPTTNQTDFTTAGFSANQTYQTSSPQYTVTDQATFETNAAPITTYGETITQPQPGYGTTINQPTTYDINQINTAPITQTTTDLTTFGTTFGQSTDLIANQSQKTQPNTQTNANKGYANQGKIGQSLLQLVNKPPQIQMTQLFQQPQIVETPQGPRVLDEDFRRGRPIYNDFRTTGYKYRKMYNNYDNYNNNRNNNIPIRPSYYNIPSDIGQFQDYDYKNAFNSGAWLNRGNNQLGATKGLSRLEKGKSYDVSRMINPLMSKAGFENINVPNINDQGAQANSRINALL